MVLLFLLSSLRATLTNSGELLVTKSAKKYVEKLGSGSNCTMRRRRSTDLDAVNFLAMSERRLAMFCFLKTAMPVWLDMSLQKTSIIAHTGWWPFIGCFAVATRLRALVSARAKSFDSLMNDDDKDISSPTFFGSRSSISANTHSLMIMYESGGKSEIWRAVK